MKNMPVWVVGLVAMTVSGAWALEPSFAYPWSSGTPVNSPEARRWRGELPLPTNAVRADAGASIEGAKQDSGVRFNESLGAGQVGEQPAVRAEMGRQEKPSLAVAGETSRKLREVPPQPRTYETDDDVNGIKAMLGYVGLAILGGITGVAAGAAVAVGSGVGVGALVYTHSNTVIGVLGGVVATVVAGVVAVPMLGHAGAALGRKIGEFLAS